MQPVAPDVQQSPGGARGRVAADDDRRGVAQELPPEALPEPARDRLLEQTRELPGGQVEEGGHHRQARGDRQRAATDRVVDGAGGPAPLGSPGGPDGRAAQEERVDGHRRGSQQAGRWQLPAPDDLEVLVIGRSGRRGRSRSGTRTIRRPAARRRRRRAARRGRRRRAAPARAPGAAGHRGRRGPPAPGPTLLRQGGIGRPGRSGHARVTTRRPADGAASGRSPRPATGRRRPAPRRRSAGSSSIARRGDRGT